MAAQGQCFNGHKCSPKKACGWCIRKGDLEAAKTSMMHCHNVEHVSHTLSRLPNGRILWVWSDSSSGVLVTKGPCEPHVHPHSGFAHVQEPDHA